MPIGKKVSNRQLEINEKYKNRLPHGWYKFTCKKTGKEFEAINDASTQIAIHFKNEYPDIEIPNNHKKKNYFNENGDIWYSQYFTYEPWRKRETLKCCIDGCDYENYDLKNLSGNYTRHIKDIHGLEPMEFIKKYPKQDYLFFKYKNRLEIETNDSMNVTCLECGGKFKTLHTHVRMTHGMSITDYRIKHNQTKKDTNSEYFMDLSKDTWNKHLKDKAFTKISKMEEILSNHLTSINIDHKTSDRSVMGDGKEIDIIIESHKIGIEINGNKWHSESFGGKDRKYHLNKTNILKEKGYRLIHIFEDEFMVNQELVLNKISHILGVSKHKTIYARKCEYRKVTKQDSDKFYTQNHIQGSPVNLENNVGLYFENNLVALMSFNKKRNMTKSKTSYDFELVRFATDLNFKITGGFSKLFKNFIKETNSKSIVSFADIRWCDMDNNVYTKNGFSNEKILPPNYYYINGNISRYYRGSKYGFGLKSLKRKNMYIEGYTEWECMKYHGYDRIWDCGLIRYVWREKEKGDRN